MGRIVVDTLAIEFELDDDDLKRGLKQATTTTQRATSRMGRAFARFERKVKDVGRSMLKFRTILGLVAGAAGLGFLISKSIDAADTLAKTADKVGLTTDSLQELRFAAELSGVNITTMDMAMQRFSRRVGEVANGTGELKGTFDRLGISVTDSSGTLKTQDQLLNEIADAIKNAKTEQEALSIAFKAFDSEGAALVNMLKDGAAGLDAFRKRARELGLVLDEKLIRGAEKAKDALTELKKVMAIAVQRAVLENVDAIKDLATAFTEATPKIIAAGRALFKFFGILDESAVEKLQAITAEIRDLEFLLESPGFETRVLRRLFGETTKEKETRDQIVELRAEMARMQREMFRSADASSRLTATTKIAGAATEAWATRIQRLSKEFQALNTDAERFQQMARTLGQAGAQKDLDKALETRIARQLVYQHSLEDAAKAEQEQAAVIRTAWEGVENAGVNAIGAWLTRTKSLKESFKGLIADLAQMIIKAQLFNAVSQFGSGGSGGGIFGTIIGALFKPGKAGGGAASGPTLVGERGPEIVNFRGGGTVTNSADTRSALRSGGGPRIVIHADMRGASVDAVNRLERFVLQINASIEPRAVAAVAFSQSRIIQ